MTRADDGSLLEISGLNIRFATSRGEVHALRDLDLGLAPGEVLGLIGESGSGKSVTLQAILRILPEKRARVSGKIQLGGKDVLAMDRKALPSYRGRDVAMIFQEPALSLDPVFTIGHQITETIRRHLGFTAEAARKRAIELLDQVRIPSPEIRYSAYPHELSGGMRQRAMIALALSCQPKLLLADEPTTALDATVQIQVILLLRELQRELGMATIFVTHDVGVAAEISDRVAVMYAGRIVEIGTSIEVLKAPRHPYTKGLLASTVSTARRGERIGAIPGMPPDLVNRPRGCAFAPRCARATGLCRDAEPPLLPIGGGTRQAACHLAGEGPE